MQRFMQCTLLLAILLVTSANSCEEKERYMVKSTTDYSSRPEAPIPEPKGGVLFGIGVIAIALALRHHHRGPTE